MQRSSPPHAAFVDTPVDCTGASPGEDALTHLASLPTEAPMYSRVKALGHPIHPMLVGFPVAFYTATPIALIVHAATHDPFWFHLAVVANCAGVVMAVAAAVPGFLDWATGIPRNHPASATGLRHLGLNVGALVVFVICAAVGLGKWNDAIPRGGGMIVLSLFGLALTVLAGYLGWTLVQNHHVGVALSPEQERLEPTIPTPPTTPIQHPARGST
jgi:uncharacterized membrane protein